MAYCLFQIILGLEISHNTELYFKCHSVTSQMPVIIEFPFTETSRCFTKPPLWIILFSLHQTPKCNRVGNWGTLNQITWLVSGSIRILIHRLPSWLLGSTASGITSLDVNGPPGARRVHALSTVPKKTINTSLQEEPLKRKFKRRRKEGYYNWMRYMEWLYPSVWK